MTDVEGKAADGGTDPPPSPQAVPAPRDGPPLPPPVQQPPGPSGGGASAVQPGTGGGPSRVGEKPDNSKEAAETVKESIKLLLPKKDVATFDGTPGTGEGLAHFLRACLNLALDLHGSNVGVAAAKRHLSLVLESVHEEVRDEFSRSILAAKGGVDDSSSAALLFYLIFDRVADCYNTPEMRAYWGDRLRGQFTFRDVEERPRAALERFNRWRWLEAGCARTDEGDVKFRVDHEQDLVRLFRAGARKVSSKLGDVMADQVVTLTTLVEGMERLRASGASLRDATSTRPAAHVVNAAGAAPAQVEPRATRDARPRKFFCFHCYEVNSHLAANCPYGTLSEDDARVASAKALVDKLAPNKAPRQYPYPGGRRGAEAGGPALQAVATQRRERFWVEAQLGAHKGQGGVKVVGLIDTGATDTFVSAQTLRTGGILYRDLGSTTIRAAEAFGGTEVEIVGRVELPITLGTRRVISHAFVYAGRGELILGMDILSRLGVAEAVEGRLSELGVRMGRQAELPAAAAARPGRPEPTPEDCFESAEDVREKAVLGPMDPDQRERLLDLLAAHHTVFLRDGALPPECNWGPAHIRVHGTPDAVMRARPRTEAQRAEMRRHEDKMEQFGIAATLVGRPPRFNVLAESLLVPKPSGDSRHVVDLSHLNPFVVSDPFPIPFMEEQVAKMAKKRPGDVWVGSKVDCSGGFYAIPLAEESQDLTAFRSTRGIMVLKRLPMGLKSSVAIYQRMIQENLINRMPERFRDETGAYVDDAAHSSSAPSRREAVDLEIGWIEHLLEACVEGNIKLKLPKCLWVVPEMEYLNAKIIEGERAPKPSAVQAILDFGPLQTKKDVQSYLGLCEGMRPYIHQYGSLVQPLRDCAKDGSRGPLVLTQDARAARERLEAAIAAAAPLLILIPGIPCTLRVDAGEFGMGVVLEQEGRMVRCWSRMLTAAERNYSASDRERLCMVEGLEAMEVHVGGRHVEVRLLTDHKPHDGAERTKDGRRRGARAVRSLRARWDERLSRFNFTSTWVPREEQVAPDALAKSPAFRLRAEEEDRIVSAQVAALQVTEAVPSDPASVRANQLRDRRLAELVRYKELGLLDQGMSEERKDGLVKQAKSFEIVDGVLYHLWTEKGDDDSVHTQLVVPDNGTERKELLEKAHGEASHKDDTAHIPEGAHESGKKMFRRLRPTHWWDTMLADCIKHAKGCHRCGEHRAINNSYGLLQPTTSEQMADGQAVALDLAGPLPPTPDGYEYLMVIIRERSGWPTLIPLKRALAEEAVKEFYKGFISVWGVPPRLRTDRANNLNSTVAEAIYDDLGLDKKTTASYNPQADGMAENLVRRAVNFIKKLLPENGTWKEALPRVEVSLRSQFSDPRGMTPFRAEFGRDMVLPLAFTNPLAPRSQFMARERVEFEKLNALRDKAAETYKAKYNKGRVDAPFKAGDLVWWKKHEIENKLSPKADGPYVVDEVLPNRLDVRLRERPQGPKIGNRHNVVNVKEIELYDQRLPIAEEEIVDEIIGHSVKSWRTRRGQRKKKVLYHVRWTSGDTTWEPARSMIDEEHGVETITTALLDYWNKNPRVRATEGR